ncbi:MAG: hypothetical protein ICV83_04770 [Cytophagales bacterium]|nr:hypothetical protein [Cytophagales bacterium]
MQTVIPILLWLVSWQAFAQTDSLLAFDRRMRRLGRVHAAVLAGWAGLNVATGAVLSLKSGGEAACFHAMNLSWGVINGSIAGFFYWHIRKSEVPPKALLRRLALQHHVEKVLLLNIGLDVAYVATGFALREHGLVPGISYPQLWRGFGTSLLVQGAFLLLQDSVFYCLHARNGKQLHGAGKVQP